MGPQPATGSVERVRHVWPDRGEVGDLAALVADDPRPLPRDRPWVLANMIASADGAIAVAGRSGGLAGPGDKALFSALRGVADVVLVGAGTVRAEGYGPPRPSDGTRRARRARGQAEAPRVAIVTRSLALDLQAPLFTEAETPPLVITCAAADADRKAATEPAAELVVAGRDQVDLGAALAELRQRGVEVVTCEGGPHLNGDLIAANLVDEWNLTVSPLLVGGEAGRASRGGEPEAAVDLRLARILADEEFVMVRWVRATEAT